MNEPARLDNLLNGILFDAAWRTVDRMFSEIDRNLPAEKQRELMCAAFRVLAVAHSRGIFFCGDDAEGDQ